jgi:hypothetical protein
MDAGVGIDCDGIGVRVQGPAAPLAQWTPDDGWTELPSAPEAPPGDWVGTEGCRECAWIADGRILRLDDAGVFRPTGLGVSDPDASTYLVSGLDRSIFDESARGHPRRPRLRRQPIRAQRR